MVEIERILFSPYLYVGEGLQLLRIENVQSDARLICARDGKEVSPGLRIRRYPDLLDSNITRFLLLGHLLVPKEDRELKAFFPTLAELLAKTFSKTVPTGKQNSRV